MQEPLEQETNNPGKGGPCPHLGLADDPDVRFAFPAPANACYKARPLASVKLNHQETYCLTAQYVACPIYRHQGQMALSQASRWLNAPDERAFIGLRRPTPRLLLAIAMAGIITTILLLSWSNLTTPRAIGEQTEGNRPLETMAADDGDLPLVLDNTRTPTPTPSATATALPASATPQPSATARPTATRSAGVTPTPSATASATNAPPTVTATPTATATVISCPPPPAGWVVYRVRPGDTLFRIGLRYGLTVTELQEANCLATSRIDAGQIIYVPFLLPAPTAMLPSPTPGDTPGSEPQPTAPPPEPTEPPPPPEPTEEPPPPEPTATEPLPEPSPIPTATPPLP